MPKRRDVVVEQLDELATNLENLWRALTVDPKKEARRERAWTLLVGGLGAAGTMAARRVVAKLWPILTGEAPPAARPAQRTSSPGPMQPREEQTAEREPEVPSNA
jgi:hypothetical protein